MPQVSVLDGLPAEAAEEGGEDEDGGGDNYFSGNVALGESFTITNGGDKFKSKVFIKFSIILFELKYTIFSL